MRLASVLAATFLFAASGCTIKPLDSDAGTSGGGTTTETVGDQCTALADAVCTHAINDCGYVLMVFSDCVASQSSECCDVMSDCAATSQTSSSALAACESAIALQDCASVFSVGVADLGACQGIPERP